MSAVGCAECRQCAQILSLMEFSCCEGFVLKCNGCRDDAVNCFPSAVMLGARGHGLRMPVAVAKHLELRTQHQALRGVLHCMAERMEREEFLNGGDGSAQSMRESLEPGKMVLDEVSMLVVALFGENVTVNVIMGVTTWEA